MLSIFSERSSKYPQKTVRSERICRRVGTIVELERLTIEDFKRILTEPINCPAERFRVLGEYRNLSLALTKKDVDFIAKKAYDMNIGARALQIVAEEFIKDKLYN